MRFKDEYGLRMYLCQYRVCLSSRMIFCKHLLITLPNTNHFILWALNILFRHAYLRLSLSLSLSKLWHQAGITNIFTDL